MGKGFFSGRSSVAPISVGEELDVKIEAVGQKGDGIAKKNGFVLFVPNTKKGDEVRVKVTRVLRRMGFAEVVSNSKGKDESIQKEEQDTKTEGAPVDTEDFGEDLK